MISEKPPMWGWVSGNFRGLKDLFNMFNDLAPILSPILSIMALCLLVIVSFLNLFSRFRRKFPVSVNCWFCNSNIKVPYTNKNSFDCPVCLQYNGFTKEGDYNKIIPEQHDEFMNASLDTTTKSQNGGIHLTNGLCTLCNNNQQLKIHQLANFVPMYEENYDAEIEHFQEQLEKAYKLCKKCDRVLKTEIDKQSAWIFGKSIKNARSFFKKPESGQQFKKTWFLTAINLSCLCLVLAVYLIGVLPCIFSTKMLNYVPQEYTQFLTKSAAPYFGLIDKNYTSFLHRKDLLPSISTGGLLLQLIALKWDRSFVKLNCVLSWLIILVTCYINTRKYLPVIVLVQMFCCGYLLSAIFSKTEKPKTPKKTKKRSMTKIVKNLENTCSDFSDIEEFENSSTKTVSNASHKEYLNTSTSSYWTSSPKDHQMNTSNKINDSFATANDLTLPARHVINQNNFNNSIDVNLKTSLSNLNLGSQGQTFSPEKLKRPRPLLSPSKFSDSFSRSSWVAGGYWKSPDGINVPSLQRTTSRSSSESSGFGSQRNENFTFGNTNPFSPARLYTKEFDSASLISNSQFNNCNNTHHYPVYHVPSIQREHYVYPNNSLFIQKTTSHLPSPNMFYVRRESLGFNPVFSRPAYNTESYNRSAFQNWSEVISSKPTPSFKDLSMQFANNHVQK